MDRTAANHRRMLEASGFTYRATHDAYVDGRGGRMLRVDDILAHTELWLARWIKETLRAVDAEAAGGEPSWASALGPPLFARRLL
jgi:hypothetical protein